MFAEFVQFRLLLPHDHLGFYVVHTDYAKAAIAGPFAVGTRQLAANLALTVQLVD
jgi:hypothetical protein